VKTYPQANLSIVLFIISVIYDYVLLKLKVAFFRVFTGENTKIRVQRYDK